MKLFGGICLLAAFASAFAAEPPPGRVVPVNGDVDGVVRAAGIPESAHEFTVAFRFRPARYVKRKGPREGLVFANGNGWDNGFRATVAPDTNLPRVGFKMSLRVVKASGAASADAASVPVRGSLVEARWYHLAFVCGGGELRSYLNGSLSESVPFKGGFKKPSCGFFVGPAGFGVGFYPFATERFFTWERALDGDEVLALVTGGDASAKGAKRFVDGLDAAAFADFRPLAWNTAGRLADGGDRRGAAELYARLAREAPADPSVDGGNEVAARLAKSVGGIDVEPAVRILDAVPFSGYPQKLAPLAEIDVAAAVHVAPGGDDAAGDGSAERPFASLRRAADAVRSRPVRQILLHGGRYAVTSGLTLTAADSGTEESPLVIAAAPGEEPVLDGGREVTGFAPCGRGAILAADLRGKGFIGMKKPRCWGYGLAGRGEKHIIDLYEDDAPGELARHPNDGFLATVWADPTNLVFKVEGLPDFAEWAKEPELMALTYMRWLWGDETTALRIDADTGAMRIDTNLVQRVGVGRPVKLLNSLKALDEPGEWFIDHSAQRLYYWPRRPGARVELSQLAEPFITLEGTEHVEIRGLVFLAGCSTAVAMKNVRHVRFERNIVGNMFSGLSVRGRDVEIVANTMRNFSCGAITVRGGDRKTLAPSGIRILRNDVGFVERKVRTYCPCVQAEGVGVEIAFNHFHDCPSSAMRLEGNDMLVTSNLVENCVLESDDQGAVDIYANPTYAGIEIVGNTWRDIGRGGRFAPCGQAAVRFDDVISGVRVRRNRFYNCGYGHFGAVQINGGRLNVIDENLFVDCRRDCSVNTRSPDWWRQTMTEGYAAPKIKAVPVGESPWRERYPYMSRLLDWPCVNSFTRNVYINTRPTRSAPGENGNVVAPRP